MADVVILGTGDFGCVAHTYLREQSEHRVVAFSAHRRFVPGPTFRDVPLIPFEELPRELPPAEVSMLVATGPARANRDRASLVEEARGQGYELISFVSPRAVVAPGVRLGANSFVFEGTILEPHTVVGDDTILWSGTTVAHHSEIGDHCFLAPRVAISGRVVVEDYCFLGINCTIRDHVRIRAGTVVGAGAVIMSDTVEDGVYSASPTRLRSQDAPDKEL